MNKLSGNCECKRISFDIFQEIKYFSHCHCSQCRRSHGSAFASFIEEINLVSDIFLVRKVLNPTLHSNNVNEYFVIIVVQILCL